MAMLGSLAWLGWIWQLGNGSEERFAPVLAGYWILGLLFMPALMMIMRRPNAAEPRAATGVQRPRGLAAAPAATPEL
jgi:hypothetical protein